jgi:outer membrane lipoprotein-sorting protein
LQTQTETEQEGKIWIKNNMYKLQIPDQVIFFDGVKIYQYLPGFNEANVMKPDPNESDGDFQLFNPMSYFNISSKTFKSKLVKESAMNNRMVYEIDLYPVQLKTTSFSRIRIHVEKSTFQLVYLKAFMKDATHYALTFKPYDVHKTALRDSFFKFNSLEYPNVEVIDLSF